MIVEITTYNPVAGVTHEELIQASKEFDQNYCSRCKGLISRHFLKTDDRVGWGRIFTCETFAKSMRTITVKDATPQSFRVSHRRLHRYV